jgi:hypothetical protein
MLPGCLELHRSRGSCFKQLGGPVRLLVQPDAHFVCVCVCLLWGCFILLHAAPGRFPFFPPLTLNSICGPCPSGFFGNGNVCIRNVTVTTLTALGAAPLIQVGESVSFNVSLFVPQKMAYNVTVRFTVPSTTAGLLVQDVNVNILDTGSLDAPALSVITNASRTSSLVRDVYIITLSSLFNDNFVPMTTADRILLGVSYVVSNVSAAVSGLRYNNSLIVQYPSFQNFTISVPNFILGQPLLNLTTLVTPSSSTLAAGSLIFFSTTIFHTALSTGSAYSVDMTEIAHPLYAVVPASISITCPLCTNAVANSVADRLRLTVNILPLGSQLVVNWSAQVTTLARPGTSIFSTAMSLTQYSTPNQSPFFGRTASASWSAVTTLLGQAPLVVFNNTLVVTGSIPDIILPSATIHETISFIVSMTLPAGTTNVTLAASLPRTNTFAYVNSVAAQILSSSSEYVTTNSPTLVSFVTNNTGNDPDLVYAYLGDVTRLPGSSSVFQVAISFVVRDLPAITNGNNLTTLVWAFADRQNFTWPSYRLVIVTPDLLISSFSVAPAIVQFNTLVSHGLTVIHSGSSRSPIYKLRVVSVHNSLFDVRSTSFACSSSCDGFWSSFNATHVVFDIDAIPLGSSVSIQWQSIIRPLANTRAGATISDSITATGFSTPFVDPSVVGRLTTRSTQRTITIASPSNAFELLSTSLNDTSGADLAPEETALLGFNLSYPLVSSNFSVRFSVPQTMMILNTTLLSWTDSFGNAVALPLYDTAISPFEVIYFFGETNDLSLAIFNLEVEFLSNGTAVNGNPLPVTSRVSYDTRFSTSQFTLTAVEPL